MDQADDTKQAYERAVRRHDALFAQMTFWDHWRGALMLPTILTGLALGYGIGRMVRLLWPTMPDQGDWFCAVVTMLAVGQGIHRYFDVRRLEAARRQRDLLASRLGRRTPAP